ncbi:MAG: hypothetical protein H7242_07045, partial [Microbacteriaceae bacterium]|nr:hypothetical protein [Burkholderiaceae bacterium]
ATLSGSTEASVGTNVQFDRAATLDISAIENSANLIKTKGSASGGGVLLGANATYVKSENKASTTASIGNDTLLPDGVVDLHANHAAKQQAESFGVTVGGLMAVGANTAEVVTSASSTATLGNVKTNASRLADIDVAAQGLDKSTAKAVAGGGGLVSGQAATATVTDTSSTTALISAAGASAVANPDAYTIRGAAISVDASRMSEARADADTVNASAVGASGAITLTQVNNSANATVGAGVRLRGLGIGVSTTNAAAEPDGGDNVAGAGGGVANGSAAVAKTNFITASNTSIGTGARLDVIGDPSTAEVGRLVAIANTDLFTRTKGSLNTGGVIDVPYAEVESTTTGNNTVSIGEGAQLRSAGDIVAGTSTLNRSNAQALIKTYGGIGITGGKSTAISTQNDTITVNNAALLQAYGDISLATGRNADSGLNLMQATAITDVYNNTAIPVSYQNPAVARTNQTSRLNLLGSSQVQAGRSVYLRNFKGDNIASAAGEGHNPYLDLFSTSTSDSKTDPKFDGTIQVNGSVTAGYYRLRDMAINSAGALTQTTDTPDLQLPIRDFTMDAAGVYRDGSNQVVAASLALRPQGYIARVNGFNPNLYYSDVTKGKLGGVANEALGAYVLPDLTVAGGSIEVDSSTVAGTGTLRAQGGPLIRVVNDSNRFLIANKMVIPDLDSGGSVSFVGAGSKPVTMTVQEINKGRLPEVALNNRYDTAFGGTASDIIIQSTLDGSNAVRNLRGSYKLNNDNGNIIEGGVEALSIDVKAPNGASIFDDATKYFAIGGVPEATWASVDAANRPNDIGGFVDTAAFYYYTNNRSGTAGDAKTYSRELQGLTDDKGTGITGYLFRKNLGNKPGSYNGDGAWYGGRYGFDILPIKTLRTTSAGTPAGAKSPGRLANRIDYTAKYIDINAPIQAGTARDIDITITNAAIYSKSFLDQYLSNSGIGYFDCLADISCRNFNGFYPEANGQYKVPAATLVYGANSPLVTVTFDAVSKRVSTAPIGTASIGAVSLVGRILNSNSDTSARSKIELSTGTIQLNIKNQSGIAFEMPQIETGGSSGDGVIRITDLNRTSQVINSRGQWVSAPLTTWWVSKNGSDVELYQSYSAPSYVGLTAIGAGTGSTASAYNPQAGWRYEWTRSASANRQLVAPAGGGAWWDWYASDWSFRYGASAPDWQVSSAGPVYSSLIDSNAYRSALSADVGFYGVSVNYSANGPASRIWQVATSITLKQQTSVRADYGLDISFKGYASGGVTIASNADTYLGRGINNPSGNTSLSVTNGSLIARDGGLIRSKDLSLNVAGNATGTGASSAVEVELGGVLNAAAGGDLAIKAFGGLNVAAASAGSAGQNRRLSLSAQGDLTSTGPSVLLRGYDVSLASTSGRIGGAGVNDALNVEVYNVGAGVSQRGLISAKADGNVNLNLSGGDIRVAAIQATDGDVRLSTNGSLFDAKEGQGGTVRSDTELQTLWEQTLKISGDKTASVQDYLRHTITPLDQQINRDYRDYWTLRALGNIGGNGQIVLGSKGLGALRAQTAAALNVVSPSDIQVNQWANTLLGRYTSSFDRLLGAGQWQAQAGFQSFDAAFRFSADRYNEYWTLKNASNGAGQLSAAGRDTIRQVAATVIGGAPSDAQLQAYANQRFTTLATAFGTQVPAAKLTAYDPNYRFVGDESLLSIYAFGNYWGAERLQNEIRQSAFGTASSGSGAIDHLNISGRNVSLSSSAAQASLGRNNGYLSLAIGQPLSDIQRYALSQASAPGDVQVLTNAAGQITGLTVKDTRPFFVDAKTRFDATALGQLYVLGQGALAIGTVQSNGAVRLTAQNGISNAGAAQAIKGSSLVLDGGTGSLGSALSPLLINTPELSLARAGDSIWLRQASGNLVVDVVSAEKDVSLTLGAGNLSQKQPGLLSVAGDSITLDVSGTVGTAPAGSGSGALVLDVRGAALGGLLKLNARDAWISSAADLRLGDSSTGLFSLNLLSKADLTLTGRVRSTGAARWLVGGDFSSDAGQALDATGDVTLTASTVSMGQASTFNSGAALALSSTAGNAVLGSLTAKTGMTLDAELGSLQSKGTAVVMTVQDAGGALKINSLNLGGTCIGGIPGGAATAPLRIAANHVSLRSAAGDARLALLNQASDLQASRLGAGSLLLQANGSLRVSGTLQTGQVLDLKAQAGFNLDAGKTLQAGTALKLEGASLDMAAGSQARSDMASATLLATQGDARVSTVTAKTVLAVDAPKGRITRVGANDQLVATGTAGLIALNQGAGNTGGLGLGEALRVLTLKADRISARTDSGGIFGHLVGATSADTQLETALAGTGEIVLRAAADLTAAGPIRTTGSIDVQSLGAFTAADRIEALGATSDLSLSAAKLDLRAELQAGRSARLASLSGDLLLKKSLMAGQDVVFTSFSAMQAQDVAAGHDLQFNAGGPVKGDSVRASHDLTVIRAPEFTVRELVSGAAMSLTLGDADIQRLIAGNTLGLHADAARLGAVTTGGDAGLVIANVLSLATGDFRSNLMLSAASATLGNIGVADNATVQGVGAVNVNNLNVGKALAVSAGSLQSQSLRTGGDADISTLAATRLVSGGIGGRLGLAANGAALG